MAEQEVEMTSVDAAEPPKSNPLAKPVAPKVSTLKLNPVVRKPAPAGMSTATLKPGLKLPPKPGLSAGLKLPPKATATSPLKPGIKLPPKPVIRKPGATVTAAPLPKPVLPTAAVPPPVTPAPAPAPAVASSAAPVEKIAPTAGEVPAKPLETLKSVTQKMKGITQEIPQQAILRKTGIIADAAMSEAQKEAAKHKTARISLSDAMGVAPVKDEAAPMKTIRIKRPVGISGSAASVPPPVKPADGAGAPPVAETAAVTEATAPAASASTITQRKTLKISRPGGVVRPSGKFGVKRPGQSTGDAGVGEGGEAKAPAGEGVGELPDIPDMPIPPMPMPSASVSNGPAWVWTLSSLVQAAACVAIAALAWLLYQNTQTNYF